MRLFLVVRAPLRLQGQVVPVRTTPFLIGRDPACQLRPSSLTVSGRHCLLGTRGGVAFVRDLDSTNGTLVNGKPVLGPVALADHDELQVGPLRFAVRIEASVPVDHSTPVRFGPGEPPGAEQATVLPLTGSTAESAAVPKGDTKVRPALPAEPPGSVSSDRQIKPAAQRGWSLMSFLRRRPRT